MLRAGNRRGTRKPFLLPERRPPSCHMPDGRVCRPLRARRGGGQLGGKAQGLAPIRGELGRRLDLTSFDGIAIDIPSLVVVGTEVFDAFLDQNDLRQIAASDLPDQRTTRAFLSA